MPDMEQDLNKYAKQFIEGKVLYKNYNKIGEKISSLTVLEYDGTYTIRKIYMTDDEISGTYVMLQPEELQGMFQAINCDKQ